MFSESLLNKVRLAEIRRKNTDPHPCPQGDFKITKPSFFIEWDKESNQFRIVNNEKHEK